VSWVRWGSFCTFAGYPWVKWCHPDYDYCPGSSVYVFEHVAGGFECCGCKHTETEEQMVEHLREHAAKGEHVPRVLYDPEVIARAEAFWKSMTRDERMHWYVLACDADDVLMSASMQAFIDILQTLPRTD